MKNIPMPEWGYLVHIWEVSKASLHGIYSRASAEASWNDEELLSA